MFSMFPYCLMAINSRIQPAAPPLKLPPPLQVSLPWQPGPRARAPPIGRCNFHLPCFHRCPCSDLHPSLEWFKNGSKNVMRFCHMTIRRIRHSYLGDLKDRVHGVQCLVVLERFGAINVYDRSAYCTVHDLVFLVSIWYVSWCFWFSHRWLSNCKLGCTSKIIQVGQCIAWFAFLRTGKWCKLTGNLRFTVIV